MTQIPGMYRRPRRALSLLELLLVLALLVAVAALAVPALQSTLKDQRLRAGAEQVRNRMGNAHVRAMKSSQVHAMYVEPGGARLRIEPWISADAALDAPADAAAPVGAAPPISGDVLLVEEPLPDGIVFYNAQPLVDDPAVVMNEQQGLGGGTMGTGAMGGGLLGGGSTPILFYPDGTTSTAQVTVTDGKGAMMVVSLRGLTGIASISPILDEEELALP